MLTAVVTQVGDAFTVHLTSVPPTTPGEETSTSEVAETTTGEAADEHHDDVTLTTDGLVAKDGIAHATVEEAAPGPNPIMPEVKELIWGAGAFIVFAIIIRYVAFPRLKKGMVARYDGIQSDHEQAAAARAAAQADVAEYQAQLAAVKAEAAATIERARQELETKRTARIAAANAEIAEKRAAAAAEAEVARTAVQSQIKGAVTDVSAQAIRLAIGAEPDTAVVNRVVDDVMSAAVAR